MPKYYRVIVGGTVQRSLCKGAYAASRVTRVFGRLDCPSRLAELDPKNRVFFLNWYDAVGSGYVPCGVCTPDVPRTGDRLPLGHPSLDARHVALWDTNPRPFSDRPQVCFYSALSWEEAVRHDGRATTHQIDLVRWLPYPQARWHAVRWGQRLCLPVIDCRILADNHVLWAPTGAPDERQVKALERVMRKPRLSLSYPTFARS